MASFTTANGMSNADTLLQQISTGMDNLNSALGVGTSGAATPVSSSSSSSTTTATSGAA
uniref:Uncharacterized protein n=1 Tax=mine drainage metagenome TaxID=410659 RepID=E6QM22_9ZZZZ